MHPQPTSAKPDALSRTAATAYQNGRQYPVLHPTLQITPTKPDAYIQFCVPICRCHLPLRPQRLISVSMKQFHICKSLQSVLQWRIESVDKGVPRLRLHCTPSRYYARQRTPGAKLRNNHRTPVLYDACHHTTARENPQHGTLRHSSAYRSAESDSKRSELECSSDLWWRSQRDSNPRAANATNTLAGCPFRPLRHDSTLHFKSATACKHSSSPRPTQIPLLLRVTVRALQRGCAPMSAAGSNPGHTRRPKS